MAKRKKLTLKDKKRIVKLIKKGKLPPDIIFVREDREVIMPSGERFCIPLEHIV